jgi:NAD(P)-dependent dehydrogenase (short-subunit alcohol dehydrogenase family)
MDSTLDDSSSHVIDNRLEKFPFSRNIVTGRFRSRLVPGRSSDSSPLIGQPGPSIRDSIGAPAIPVRRVAEPSDIARAALFLASDLSHYVTGNVLTLDGGATGFVPTPIIKI